MQLVTAPDESRGVYPISVFLAGGITNCADWQGDAIGRLLDKDITIFNPRRHKMPVGSLEVEKQISWEHWRLRRADILAFWFSPETDCPITLFELGSALSRRESQILVVGCSPKYKRRFDVITQCRLVGQTSFVGWEDFIAELREKISCL